MKVTLVFRHSALMDDVALLVKCLKSAGVDGLVSDLVVIYETVATVRQSELPGFLPRQVPAHS